MTDKVAVCAVYQGVFIPKFLYLIFADIGNACGDRLVDLVCRTRLGGGDEGDLFAEGVARSDSALRFVQCS